MSSNMYMIFRLWVKRCGLLIVRLYSKLNYHSRTNETSLPPFWKSVLLLHSDDAIYLAVKCLALTLVEEIACFFAMASKGTTWNIVQVFHFQTVQLNSTSVHLLLIARSKWAYSTLILDCFQMLESLHNSTTVKTLLPWCLFWQAIFQYFQRTLL